MADTVRKVTKPTMKKIELVKTLLTEDPTLSYNKLNDAIAKKFGKGLDFTILGIIRKALKAGDVNAVKFEITDRKPPTPKKKTVAKKKVVAKKKTAAKKKAVAKKKTTPKKRGRKAKPKTVKPEKRSSGRRALDTEREEVLAKIKQLPAYIVVAINPNGKISATAHGNKHSAQNRISELTKKNLRPDFIGYYCKEEFDIEYKIKIR